jgi:CHAT domain-containing protein
VSEALFNALFPSPFAERLAKSRLIIFVPDNVLFLLPLEMLSPDATRGKFVLLNTATEYFPSAAAFSFSRTVGRANAHWDRQFIGIGDPITSPEDERYLAATALTTMRSGSPEPAASSNASRFRTLSVDKLRAGGFALERLPGTAAEVNNVAQLFSRPEENVEVRTGVDATKRELLATDLSRFRFVHFATHGILPVEEAIKEPSLVLSYQDSGTEQWLLSLSDVLQLRLNAEMVVLSACNTGSGKVTKAEGVSSLGSAFLAAGAESAVVSLWQVSDVSTSLFMQELYKNLMNGKSKAESLASARAVLVAQGFDNPFFWAPFVLTGE